MAPIGLETLSKRAAENVQGIDYWELLVAALENPWSPTNSQGMAILGVAENTLMHRELQEHIEKNFTIDPPVHFSYGKGPQGSTRLLKALSSLFNEHFHPLQQTYPNEFCMSTGVTAMIDHMTFAICNEGEAILFPQPLYAGFTNDLPHRARGKLVPVPFLREDGTFDLNDVFDADANARCFERAYQKCQDEDITVRGVMITNPHNPLGKSYSANAIKAIAAFCSKYNLHYLSDEIYALSVFENSAYPKATKFTSVLSLDLGGIIDPLYVHVLYGMSKDFCGNGLRLGTLHSRNVALRSVVMGIAAFGWEAYLVQDMWARILEDKPFLDYFISVNQKRLAERYDYVTRYLEDHGMSYFKGGNSGVFIWVDLRDWFRRHVDSITGRQSNPNDLLVDNPHSAAFTALEAQLSKEWWRRGAMISKGTSYSTEELGWFRIVFTVDESCLKLGLQRFVDGVHEIMSKGNVKLAKTNGHTEVNGHRGELFVQPVASE